MIPVWSTLLSDIGLASLCGVEGVISSLSSSLDDDDDDDDAIGAFYVHKLFLSHKIKKHNVGPVVVVHHLVQLLVALYLHLNFVLYFFLPRWWPL